MIGVQLNQNYFALIVAKNKISGWQMIFHMV